VNKAYRFFECKSHTFRHVDRSGRRQPLALRLLLPCAPLGSAIVSGPPLPRKQLAAASPCAFGCVAFPITFLFAASILACWGRTPSIDGDNFSSAFPHHRFVLCFDSCHFQTIHVPLFLASFSLLSVWDVPCVRLPVFHSSTASGISSGHCPHTLLFESVLEENILPFGVCTRTNPYLDASLQGASSFLPCRFGCPSRQRDRNAVLVEHTVYSCFGMVVVRLTPGLSWNG